MSTVSLLTAESHFRASMNGGSNKDDSTIYFMCNEEKQDVVIEELGCYDKKEKSIHIGFSSWFNFDILATRDPSIAVIGDISPKMIDYLDLIKTVILRSANRASFLKNLTEELNYQSAYFGLPKEGAVFFFENELDRKESWLFSDEKFDVIKHMYEDDKIMHVKWNICDVQMFLKVQRLITENGLSVDTVYVSNIYEWLKSADEQSSFKRNLKMILEVDSLLIDAFNSLSSEVKVGPPLRITRKESIHSDGLPSFEKERPVKRRRLIQPPVYEHRHRLFE